MFLGWFIGEMVIITAMTYAAYRLLWKKDRPAGSLGFRVRGISYAAAAGGLVDRTYNILRTRRIVHLARRIDLTTFRHQTIMASLTIIIVILANLGFSGALGVVPDLTTDGGGEGEGPGDYQGRVMTLPLETEHDYIYEDETLTYVLGGDLVRDYLQINATLSWQDEEPFRVGYTNEPDELRLELTLDDGTTITTLAMDSSGAGRVRIEWTSPEPMEGHAIIVSVTAEVCGNQVPTIGGPLGLRERADNGNSFDLEVEMTVAE